MYPLERKIKVFSYRTQVALPIGINKRASLVADITWIYTGQGVYMVTWDVEGLTGAYACNGVPTSSNVTRKVRKDASAALALEAREWAKRYGQSDFFDDGVHVIPDCLPVDNPVDNSEKSAL